MTALKPVEFRGSSLDDLRAFPLAAKREAGFQKKSEKTSKADLDLASKRYRDLLKELDQ